jgi:hypothetical protein
MIDRARARCMIAPESLVACAARAAQRPADGGIHGACSIQACTQVRNLTLQPGNEGFELRDARRGIS